MKDYWISELSKRIDLVLNDYMKKEKQDDVKKNMVVIVNEINEQNEKFLDKYETKGNAVYKDLMFAKAADLDVDNIDIKLMSELNEYLDYLSKFYLFKICNFIFYWLKL